VAQAKAPRVNAGEQALRRLFPRLGPSVDRLGEVITLFAEGLTGKEPLRPTKRQLRAFERLAWEGSDLAFRLAWRLRKSPYPSQPSKRWYDAQAVPDDVPKSPAGVWALPGEEREQRLAEQHVRACVAMLQCLWSLAKEQAAAKAVAKVHCVLHEMGVPFVHVQNHLAFGCGCALACRDATQTARKRRNDAERPRVRPHAGA
jgi:hypothetical protein